MAIAREAEPVGSLTEVREAGLDREDLLGIYRYMLITRGVEERGHILYRQGKIPGSFYTGRGNEAAAVGVATAMGPEDVGTPLHRDMGVHIVRGVEPWKIFAQFMGRADGPTKGRDGNVHLADAKLGLIAMVSHLPAMLPVATGAALAFRIREERRVSLGWFGEGASARGDAHESMTLAGTRQLPIVFVCDNNQWAYSTPTHLEFATEHVADRAQAVGDGLQVGELCHYLWWGVSRSSGVAYTPSSSVAGSGCGDSSARWRASFRSFFTPVWISSSSASVMSACSRSQVR